MQVSSSLAPFSSPASSGRRLGAPATREELQRSALLRDFSLDRALDLFAECRVLALVEGDALTEPGDESTCVYLLLSGRLRVDLESDDEEPVCELEAGAVAGELSLLSGGSRSARVGASAPSRVLELPASVFWSLVCSSHEVAVNLLEILAARLRGSNGTIAQGRRLTQLYKRHASIDALTGLHNRRWLDDVLPRQVRRAEMQGKPLSVLMVDIDHFKRFNDQWGHATGDFVLFGVSQLMRERLRPTDLLARYGGEELTAVLPKTDGPGARVAAERLRCAIASTPFELQDGTLLPNVTISIGVADAAAGRSAAEMLAAADEALYRAKRNGRNRVET